MEEQASSLGWNKGCFIYESFKAATNHCCSNWTSVMGNLTKHESFCVTAKQLKHLIAPRKPKKLVNLIKMSLNIELNIKS